MPGRWKFQRDQEVVRRRKVRIERQKKTLRPTSFVLGKDHLDFLQRKSEECTVRLGKLVCNSHIIRALLRQAMDEERYRERVWNEKDLF